MLASMCVGADKFFIWADSKDAHVEITYMPACGELEIKVCILGEGDFYRKRAGDFASFLTSAKLHYEVKA